MSRVAFYWTTGGLAAIVVLTVFGNPIAAIIAALVSGVLIDRLEKA